MPTQNTINILYHSTGMHCIQQKGNSKQWKIKQRNECNTKQSRNTKNEKTGTGQHDHKVQTKINNLIF